MATLSDEQLRAGRKSSVATSRVVPVVVTLIVAYITYVVVGNLSVDYLLRSDNRHVGVATAVIVIWFVLLMPFLLSWVRLLYVVILDPGYTEQHPLSVNDGDRTQTPGLEAFYTKDMFVCDQYGLPIFCRYCNNWKPDRAHHSQDVGRCTMKMDHFCPWVGGVVGERAYKFFVQFLVYAFFQSTYATIVLAYYVGRDRGKVQWIVALALAGFFVFFTLGMVVNSLWMIFRNVSTVENLDISPGGKVIYMAVHLPAGMAGHDQNVATIDGVNVSQNQDTKEGHRDHRPPFSPWRGTITYPLALPADRPPLPAPIPRTFAVLELPAGLNPWNLGSRWENFKAVLGEKPHHWISPFHYSPCCDHSSMSSYYALGPGFASHLKAIGLPTTSLLYDPFSGTSTVLSTPSKTRKKRVLEHGWQNGERPNGWWTQKEARRMRHQERLHHEDKR